MVHVALTCTIHVLYLLNLHFLCIVQLWYMLTEHVPCLKRRCTKRLRIVMVQGYKFYRKTLFLKKKKFIASDRCDSTFCNFLYRKLFRAALNVFLYIKVMFLSFISFILLILEWQITFIDSGFIVRIVLILCWQCQ